MRAGQSPATRGLQLLGESRVPDPGARTEGLLRSGVVAADGGDVAPRRAFARAWKGDEASLLICSHFAALAALALGMADTERRAVVNPKAAPSVCDALVGVMGS